MHLSALEFIRAQKQSVQLASYDERLVAAARLAGHMPMKIRKAAKKTKPKRKAGQASELGS